MIKQGVKFDYDLMANEHVKEQDVCKICGEHLRCRWSDLHGEGVCMVCGAPYQLLHYDKNDKFIKDAKPILNIKNKWIPIIKEYWEKTKKFCFGGQSFSEDTGKQEFNDWLEENHPELIKKPT